MRISKNLPLIPDYAQSLKQAKAFDGSQYNKYEEEFKKKLLADLTDQKIKSSDSFTREPTVNANWAF